MNHKMTSRKLQDIMIAILRCIKSFLLQGWKFMWMNKRKVQRMSPPCLFWCIWRGHNDQIFDEEKLPDRKLNENLVKSFLEQSGAPLGIDKYTFWDLLDSPKLWIIGLRLWARLFQLGASVFSFLFISAFLYPFVYIGSNHSLLGLFNKFSLCLSKKPERKREREGRTPPPRVPSTKHTKIWQIYFSDPLRAQTFKDSSTAPSINTKCTLNKGILPTSTLTFAHSSSVLRRLQRSKIAITGDPKPQQCTSKQLIVTHPYTSICNTNSQESSPSHELVNGEDLLPNNLPYEETKPRWCILIPCYPYGKDILALDRSVSYKELTEK